MGARRNEANLSRPREISLRSETKIRLRSTFATFVARQALKLVFFVSTNKFDLYSPFNPISYYTFLIYLKIQDLKKKTSASEFKNIRLDIQ